MTVVSQMPSELVSLDSSESEPFSRETISSTLSWSSGIEYAPPVLDWSTIPSHPMFNEMRSCTTCSQSAVLKRASVLLTSLMTCAGEITQRTPSLTPRSPLSQSRPLDRVPFSTLLSSPSIHDISFRTRISVTLYPCAEPRRALLVWMYISPISVDHSSRTSINRSVESAPSGRNTSTSSSI